MADKSVGELIAAKSVTPTDLFVLEQNGTAKKLTGQILENWLVSFADGHGGIQSIKKLSTSGLADTYRITLADTTTFDFVVTNGRGITGISKTSTSGLVDTYTISYNNGTTSTFTVKNGEKGDKGDNAYTWIKYASQQPTAAIHSMGDIPDTWMGIYTGTLAAAPTDWTQYKWYRVRGDQGATGAPATLTGRSVTYMASDSGTVVPSGSWSSDVPTVTQGRYLWTRVVLTFNSGSPVTYYSVSRFGIDGSGAVSSVNGKDPDPAGNVRVNAEDITTTAGTSVEAALAQKQEKLTAGAGVRISGSKISTAAAPRNLLDNSDFRNPVAQAGIPGMHGSIRYAIDRWLANTATVTQQTNCLRASGKAWTAELRQFVDGVGTLHGKTLTFAVKLRSPMETGYIGIFPSDNNGMIEGAYQTLWFSTKSDWDVAVVKCTIPAEATALYVAINNPNDGVDNYYEVEWAALYEGEYTAETLPEYQPKGIAQERIACQRFFVRADAWRPIYGYASWCGEISLFLPTPTEMRINPTATTLKGTLYINGSSIDIDETPANVIKTIQGLQIILRTKTPENSKHNCALNLAETAAYFSADL